MTTIHHTPPPGATPFAIYEDMEDQEPPSPSEMYDGETSFNSELSLPGADEAIPSIEHEQGHLDEPQPYRSSYTSRPSIMSNTQLRRASGVTTTSFISEIPSEMSVASKPLPPANNGIDSKFTPRKERPPFRNPSSVRALQMSSPPPFTTFESPRDRLKGTYKLATPSRSGRSETPVSAAGSKRSGSHRGNQLRESQAFTQQSPRPIPTPQQHLPLILLHVTILPMQLPYTHDFMVKAMPEWLLENYRVLAEKLEDIILMRRGLLIPHPREEYDVLEERILESLELKTPRLLKCGHFIPPGDDAEEGGYSEDESGSVADDGTGRGSRMSGGTITVEEDGEWKASSPECDDASICTDCYRQVKKPGRGIGIGTKKWDIKIYAANGLMRAGAWSAAWREMESCDVEITLWIPEDVRKALERKIVEEQEAERQRVLHEIEKQRRVDEEAAQLKRLEMESEEKRKLEEAELQKSLEIEAENQRKCDEDTEEAKRLDDTLNERIEEVKESIRLEIEAQALAESDLIAERFRVLEEKLKSTESERVFQPSSVPDLPAFGQHARQQSRGRLRSTSRQPMREDIPLGTLLKNYFVLLARDQKNVIIVILGVFVVFLAMHMNPGRHMQLTTSSLPSKLPDDKLPDPNSQVVVTTTATMTTTAISTTTLTHVEYQSIDVPQITSPSHADSIAAVGNSRSASNDISPTVAVSEPSASPVSASQKDASESSGPPSPANSSSTLTVIEEANPSSDMPASNDPSEKPSDSALSIPEPDSDTELAMIDLFA